MAAELAEVQRNAEAIRRRCLTLHGFIQEFWHIVEPKKPFVSGWAIQAICKHLEAVTSGDIQYLLINVPPGMMKSLAVAVFWPAWEWGPKGMADLRFLTSSYSWKNALRDNKKMRRLVESDKFQALYGDSVSFAKDQNAKDNFENTSLGGRECRSFKNMTGGRGDRVIIDDPHSVDGGESDTQRPNDVTTFREAIPDRLNDMQTSAIVVIMQRIHSDDVSGSILADGLPYVHLNLPMEFEAYREENGERIDARCRTYVNGDLFFEDPRTEEGELLFPERFPEKVVEGLKTSKGSYAYSGQYQQRPVARGGGMFKREWFAGKTITREEVPSTVRSYCRGWDFAGTVPVPGKKPDWSVGLLMARDGVDYYIMHVDRFQATPGKVRSRARMHADNDPVGTIVRIPQEPGQAGVDQVANYVTALAGFRLSAVRPSGAKDIRAKPFSIQCEAGHVYLVEGEWINTFLDEVCTFPMGSFDDQVDAAADAFNELALGKSQRFEAASAGERPTIAQVERDSRYNFDDKAAPKGSGWGSVPATHRGIL